MLMHMLCQKGNGIFSVVVETEHSLIIFKDLFNIFCLDNLNYCFL